MELTPLLDFTSVAFRYEGAQADAVQDVSFTLRDGDGVALVGANGAGKTTVLRLAMALLHPQAGAIRVAGERTFGLMPEDVARHAGFLFQQPEHQLFASRVREDVAFGPRRLGMHGVDDAVNDALDQLELRPVEADHPYDLPAPRRRLVALAGVLALRPRLMLLDEPTAGLDGHSRALVRRAIRAHRTAGGAALAVSHDGEFVLEAMDGALVLDRGHLVTQVRAAEALGMASTPARPAYADLAARLHAPAAGWRFAQVVEFIVARCRVDNEA